MKNKTKNKVKILLITILCIIALFAYNFINNYQKIKKYKNITSNFISVSINDIKNKINEKDILFLYVGRESCPWCVEAVPILNDVFLELKIKLYYLNSINTPNDIELQKFREKYEIELVPSLLVFHEGKYREINLDFVTKNKKEKSTKILKEKVKNISKQIK